MEEENNFFKEREHLWQRAGLLRSEPPALSTPHTARAQDCSAKDCFSLVVCFEAFCFLKEMEKVNSEREWRHSEVNRDQGRI